MQTMGWLMRRREMINNKSQMNIWKRSKNSQGMRKMIIRMKMQLRRRSMVSMKQEQRKKKERASIMQEIWSLKMKRTLGSTDSSSMTTKRMVSKMAATMKILLITMTVNSITKRNKPKATTSKLNSLSTSAK